MTPSGSVGAAPAGCPLAAAKYRNPKNAKAEYQQRRRLGHRIDGRFAGLGALDIVDPTGTRAIDFDFRDAGDVENDVLPLVVPAGARRIKRPAGQNLVAIYVEQQDFRTIVGVRVSVVMT